MTLDDPLRAEPPDGFTMAACLETFVATTRTVDPVARGLGSCFVYLVRSEHTCVLRHGAPGTDFRRYERDRRGCP